MTNNLSEFVDSAIDPFPDDRLGEGHRCTAVLQDGTQLLCVMLRRTKPMVDLAERRLEEEKAGNGVFKLKKNPYREMLKHFVTTGNRINGFAIKYVEKSRYALPLSLLDKIQGETIMGWTGFVLTMRDGRNFNFGTSYSFEFFDLPDGYEFEDVSEVHNHAYVDANGNLRQIREDWSGERKKYIFASIFREKPHFECYMD